MDLPYFGFRHELPQEHEYGPLDVRQRVRESCRVPGIPENRHLADKTMLVLESRMAGGNASINKAGHFQTTETMGYEVHVKDARFAGGWAFFGFDDDKPAKMISTKADCYSCHQQHGAVDTTFVNPSNADKAGRAEGNVKRGIQKRGREEVSEVCCKTA